MGQTELNKLDDDVMRVCRTGGTIVVTAERVERVFAGKRDPITGFPTGLPQFCEERGLSCDYVSVSGVGGYEIRPIRPINADALKAAPTWENKITEVKLTLRPNGAWRIAMTKQFAKENGGGSYTFEQTSGPGVVDVHLALEAAMAMVILSPTKNPEWADYDAGIRRV